MALWEPSAVDFRRATASESKGAAKVESQGKGKGKSQSEGGESKAEGTGEDEQEGEAQGDQGREGWEVFGVVSQSKADLCPFSFPICMARKVNFCLLSPTRATTSHGVGGM